MEKSREVVRSCGCCRLKFGSWEFLGGREEKWEAELLG